MITQTFPKCFSKSPATVNLAKLQTFHKIQQKEELVQNF